MSQKFKTSIPASVGAFYISICLIAALRCPQQDPTEIININFACMTPAVDSTPMWCSGELKESEKDLGIAGNNIAVNFACMTPPFDSMKFGAPVVAPTAKNSGTKLQVSSAVEWQILAPNFMLSRAAGRLLRSRWLDLAFSTDNLRLKLGTKGLGSSACCPCLVSGCIQQICFASLSDFTRSDQILIYGEKNFAIGEKTGVFGEIDQSLRPAARVNSNKLYPDAFCSYSAPAAAAGTVDCTIFCQNCF